MPKRLTLVTKVATDDLDPVLSTVTRDGQSRVTQVYVEYDSVKITYTITWNGTAIEVAGMAARTYEDSQ